jgi:Clostripain family
MKWTILFIVHGLGDELAEPSQVLTNLISHGNWRLQDVNLLLLKSSIKKRPGGKIIESTLYKVNSKWAIRNGKPKVVSQKSFPDINIGDQDKLTAVFSYVRQKFPSQKLMVGFFDHGSGFGIFEAVPGDAETAGDNSENGTGNSGEHLSGSAFRKKKGIFIPAALSRRRRSSSKAATDKKEKSVLSKKLSKARKDVAVTDMLTMEELSRAFRNGFKRKVDVLVMVNCNMQMIETGYTLRNDVEYLVASETLFWIYGINYREVLFMIDSHPNISPRKVAEFCITTLEFRYERIGLKKNLSDVFFTALHLGKMNPVYELLDEISDSLKKAIPKEYNKLKKARNNGIELSQYKSPAEIKREYEASLFYDLIFFLKETGMQKAKISLLFRSLRAAIVDAYAGEEFVAGRKPLLNGVSVFLPFTKTDFGNTYYRLFYKSGSPFRTDFSGTKWGEFITALAEKHGA